MRAHREDGSIRCVLRPGSHWNGHGRVRPVPARRRLPAARVPRPDRGSGSGYVPSPSCLCATSLSCMRQAAANGFLLIVVSSKRTGRQSRRDLLTLTLAFRPVDATRRRSAGRGRRRRAGRRDRRVCCRDKWPSTRLVGGGAAPILLAAGQCERDRHELPACPAWTLILQDAGRCGMNL